MRLLICAGMTGGGVYPALAVHQALENKLDATLWVGSKDGLEETLLAPFDIPFIAISGGGIHGMNLVQLPKNIFELMRGYQQSKKIVGEFKPDVILYTGGYIGVPMALAARQTPSVVFVPDIEPGLALKVIMRNANMINVTTNDSLKYLSQPEKTNITGYPLRKEIMQWDKKSGRKHFGLRPKDKVLLAFGGSKGAQSINDALIQNLPALLKEMHVIHITGTANWERVKNQTDRIELVHPENYHAFPFLHEEIGAAFSAADLVVCRAGASTIGELPYFGLPAILVPYPHAWKYQLQNAEFLVSRGGAELLKDEELKNGLKTRVLTLMHDEEKLKRMRDAMQSTAKKNAAHAIAENIIAVGQTQAGGKNK